MPVRAAPVSSEFAIAHTAFKIQNPLPHHETGGGFFSVKVLE